MNVRLSIHAPATGEPVAHQWFGKRFPLPSHRAQNPRRRPLPIWAALDSRDAFLSLMKTCAKQAISFWDNLGERLGVPDAPAVPSLAEFIRTLAFL
jgi:hypothetical protein